MPPVIYPAIELTALLPEIILLAGGCLVLLLAQWPQPALVRWTPRVVLGTLLVAIGTIVVQALLGGLQAWSGSGLSYGPLAIFARNSTLVLGFIITFVAWREPQPQERGEFWSMVLFGLAGLMLTGAANDLLLLFLAVELVSISGYVLVALSRRHLAAIEASTKYFYLGAVSAALMAYGFALLYGVAGTTLLTGTFDAQGQRWLPSVVDAVTAALADPGTLRHGLASVGLVLSLAGLLFKIAAVPLHFYIADVYQGASSPVAGLLGFVPKFAGLLALMRVLELSGFWHTPSAALFWLLWWIAAASMIVGNTLALLQTNLKRLLAYSGIAHAGYMLVGLLIGPTGDRGLLGDGTAAVLFYAVVYGLANLGAFAVLGLLRVRGRPAETLRDVAGLLRRHPGLALLLALAMLTLMGLPPTAGFWGKLSLFGSALASTVGGAPSPRDPWLVGLVIIALLNSALAAAYYLRVVAAVLLYENDEPAEATPDEIPQVGALLCGFLLLVFGFAPGFLLDPGRRATAGLRQVAMVQQEDPPVASAVPASYLDAAEPPAPHQ